MLASWPRQGVAILAIDTNLIVRYLTGDQPQQSRKARAKKLDVAVRVL